VEGSEVEGVARAIVHHRALARGLAGEGARVIARCLIDKGDAVIKYVVGLLTDRKVPDQTRP